MTTNALSELWAQIKFNLCFAFPMRFATEAEHVINVGPGQQLELVESTWWQWRDHVFWMSERRSWIHS